MANRVSKQSLRLLIALTCAVIALLLYLPAEAKATASHDFYHHLVHPWENSIATMCILALCVTSGFTAMPILRQGLKWQRMTAAIILLVPAFILARFLLWVAHLWLRN